MRQKSDSLLIAIFVIGIFFYLFFYSLGWLWGTILIVCAAIIAYIQQVNRPMCSHCRSQIGPRYRFGRIDGGADRRYHSNPLICSACSAVWAPVNSKSIGK